MQSQWKPIETAPKDFTDVLLYFPDFSPEYRIIIGHWVACEEDPDDEPWWFEQDVDRGCINGPLEGEPTHWMELPEAPKAPTP